MFCVVLLSLLAGASAMVATTTRYPTAAPLQPTYPPSHGYGPTFEQVSYLIRTVEEDLKEIQVSLAAATTLCSVAWERLKFARDKRLRALESKDAQIAALVDLFSDEIKSMQHRADAGQSVADQGVSRAAGLAQQIANTQPITGSATNLTDGVTERIANLTAQLADHKARFLDNLKSSIDNLESELDAAKDKVDAAHEFVESRKCEYGFFAVNLEENYKYKRINFSTAFNETPTVSTSTVGFSAHLDVHTYQHEYDVLGLDKFVDIIVDAAGFEAHAVDVSTGKVDLKVVYCNYMACQNLEDEFALPAYLA